MAGFHQETHIRFFKYRELIKDLNPVCATNKLFAAVSAIYISPMLDQYKPFYGKSLVHFHGEYLRS
ncbi:hypothetical protein BMS3Abin16_01072 [archaeon BMS3Abin16]|nr:hypothetical protein BMS3Abin16_01072 [archaeon BMS3Abin16]